MKKLIITALLLASSNNSLAENKSATHDISEQYQTINLSLQHDNLSQVYAENIMFFDPTGDVFGPPFSLGPVAGRDTVIAMQKSWQIKEMDFEQQQYFTVGEYAVRNGNLAVKFGGSDQKIAFPFVTIHRVIDGKIAERHDFGAYVGKLAGGKVLQDKSVQTLSIAKTMLAAYLNEDIETQNNLLSSNTWFHDPTAEIYGGEFLQPIQGAKKLIDRRQTMYEKIDDFTFDVTREFASNNHAVFSGTLKYVYDDKYLYEQQAIIVFEVKDQLITRHWDFVDYSTNPKKIKDQSN